MQTDTTTTTVSPAKLSAFVPAALRDELEQSARANYRSLSAEIRLALARHVAQGRGDPTNKHPREGAE